MADLNYKASNIAKAERLHGLNFFKTLEGFAETSPSLSDILFVLEAGGVTEDEAGEMVDQHGLVAAIEMAVKQLTEAGFLANSQAALQAATPNAPAEASPTTGATTKA